MYLRIFLFLASSVFLISCGQKDGSPQVLSPSKPTHPSVVSSEIHATGSRQIEVAPLFDPTVEKTIKNETHSGVTIIQRTNGPSSR